MGALDTVVSIHQDIWASNWVSMRLITALLVGGLALANGAVIPRQPLLEMMTAPGAFADALSKLRVKRSTDGNTVDFQVLGADVKLEYLAEEANGSSGSKFVVVVDNLDKSFSPQFPKHIKLVFKFDKGSAGASSVVVDYELHHQTNETGKFIFKTALEANKYHLELSLRGEGGDAIHSKLIPNFGLHLDSDLNTFVEGSVTLPSRHKYSYKLSRRGIEQFVITGHQSVEEQQKPSVDNAPTDPADIFKFGLVGLQQLVNSASTTGPTYKVQIDIDYQNKMVGLKFLKDTQELIDGKIRAIINPPESIELKLNAVVKGPGKLDAKLALYGDTLEMKATRNDQVIVNAKGKLVMVPAGAEAELKYNGISELGEGKIQLGATQISNHFEQKVEFKFHVLPNSGVDLKIDGSTQGFANRTKISLFSITRNNEVYLKSFRKNITPMPQNPGGFEYFEENNLHVSNKSIFYRYYCLHECFNDRSYITKMNIADLKDWSKLSYSFNSVRDGVNDMAVELKTDAKPIHFKLLYPAFLSKHFGQESIDVNVDFDPTKHLTIKTNLKQFSSFAFTMNGNAFEVSLMDNKLFSGTVTPGDKQVVLDITTLSTDKLKLTFSWERTSFDKNVLEASVQYEKPDVDAHIVDAKVKLDWDFRRNLMIKLDAQDKKLNKSMVLTFENGSLSVGA